MEYIRIFFGSDIGIRDQQVMYISNVRFLPLRRHHFLITKFSWLLKLQTRPFTL